ncbi:MAG: photosystem I reaction center subunit PsaK [Leptolyngbyaceae bacterium]|nr:photosystem I reaction center subunit PsaK [Leptolyngbyaceae bacterium]
MLYSTLLAVAPSASNWTPSVGIIMAVCSLLAIAIGRFAIQHAGEGGPRFPLALPAIWDKFGTPELLATLSFGHILGAGVVLGLRNSGVI